MNQPLVTVICLCYNQQSFVEESIRSVLNQTYKNVQLIVVDDASTDDSARIIQSLVDQKPAIQFLSLPRNLGNCRAFNQGLVLAKGSFLIDLAADDVLMPNRIEVGVQTLLEKGEKFGVHFSDAELMDRGGNFLYRHSDRFPHQQVPQGDVYAEVIRRYFICSPTVMFTRRVADVLGGYDESLSYEDFDFWVRSSRTFYYAYTPQVLIRKRIFRNTMSSRQFSLFSPHSASTLRVCEKIFRLNHSREEQQALQMRLLYEIRLNLRLLNWITALKFLRLLIRNWRKQ